MKIATRSLATLALAVSLACAAHAQDAPEQAVGTRLADGTGYVSIARIEHGSTQDRGRLLMVFEQNGMGGIPLWESRDHGDTWHFLMNVTDQVHASDKSWQLRWQPHITELERAAGDLSAGTLVLSANATGNDAKGHVVTEDLQVYVSQDGGKTWRYRSSIVKGGGRPEDKDNKGVWESYVHVLDDGRLVAYYSTEQHKAEGYNQLLAHKVSDDGGRRWGQEERDVAIPGGVQRPGMAIVTRLPDKRYAMTYENIDGPDNGQVFIKFSRDGLDWGDPQRHGEPVMTLSGFWPAACPVVRWFPLGGPEGVIVVSAERAGGGGGEGGRTLYWNNASGRGPWWEVRAPVQKLTGNIHAGWTQELLLRDDGSLLHVTSSSVPDAPTHASRNEILYRAATLSFNRYEAEDAAFTGAVAVPDPRASNLRKARLGAGPQARLRFVVNSTGGTHALSVRYADLGLAAQPALVVNGARVSTPRPSDVVDGWHEISVQANLLPGFNTIDIDGGEHVLDVDYLQVDGQAPAVKP
ncbi:exo-alpha-sialidase [Dyella jiangningensis]|uniref:Glycosyl hydrolase n=1 Tax=Dyella jiangningensis TaxID=1379159 RepID=A0A328P2Z9_9GAMM|nr:exo-alpha-sialidase [Dyella jiangningensis]RAO76557.1 glycosyl hydrolase [Dyella jiangningensis]